MRSYFECFLTFNRTRDQHEKDVRGTKRASELKAAIYRERLAGDELCSR